MDSLRNATSRERKPKVGNQSQEVVVVHNVLPDPPIPPSNGIQGRGGRGRNYRGSGRGGGRGRGTYPPGPCFYCGKGGHQLVDCADKIAKKPSIATLASLETLEMIEQKQNWMDDPILVAVAKSNLAVLRAQEGIRDRVFRIRGVFADI